jgi:ribonuclease HI
VDDLKTVTIYTDGGATDNPGPGGYGAVLIYGKHRKELSGGYRLTTNNRMELLAVITGLEALKRRCRVTVFSDSQYVVNAIEKGWAVRWRAKNWWRNKDEKALNPDLWEKLLRLCEHHRVKFKWVRGHAGNKENERCDELVRNAAQGPNLAIDVVYEKGARSGV